MHVAGFHSSRVHMLYLLRVGCENWVYVWAAALEDLALLRRLELFPAFRMQTALSVRQVSKRLRWAV